MGYLNTATTLRLSIIYDKAPIPLEPQPPSLSDVYTGAGIKPGSDTTLMGQPWSWPNPASYSRFEILYQETFELQRGEYVPGTDPPQYATIAASVQSFDRDILLGNRVMEFRTDATNGLVESVGRGNLYFAWQSDGTWPSPPTSPQASAALGGGGIVECYFRCGFVDLGC